MQMRRRRIWTRRNEILWRRRTWRTEHRECAAVVFFWGGIARPNVDVPRAGRFQPTLPVESFVFGSLARRSRVSCNAVRSDFFSGGIKSRAEGSSPLNIPTLCRGSAAVNGGRARSCRCPRAGRKLGITMAECFISTTTPGKRHGLTPEIGMLKAWEHWEHTYTKWFYSTARPAKLS